MNIVTIHENLKNDREEFLDAADEVAAVTIPSIKPRGDWPGASTRTSDGVSAKPTHMPQTYTGVQAVRSLSATVMDTMMPHGIKWARLDLPPVAWHRLEALAAKGGIDPAVLRQDLERRLDRRATEAVLSLKQKNAVELLASVVRRNLVEGTDALINLPRIIDVLPLRCVTVKRVSGRVALAIFEEEVQSDLLKDEVKGTDSKRLRYTLVQYPDPENDVEGGVWTQMDNEQEAKAVKDRRPEQYIVFTGEIPDIGHYSVGYAYNFIRLIKNLDHAEASLNEAMAIAALNRPMAREGSSLAENLDEINKKRPGEWAVANPDDAWWLNSEMKIGDWAFIAQIAARYDDKLAQAFAMGIKDRGISADTSATAVLEIVKELNRQTQDLVQTLEKTLFQPLIRSELLLLEDASPLYPEDAVMSSAINSVIEVVITTGVNAIQSQRAIMQFAMQFLPMVMQMDPRVRANGEGLIEVMTDTMQVDRVERTYRIASDDEMQQEAMMAQGGGMEAPAAEGEQMMTRGGPQRRGGAPQPQKAMT